ncbi:hypothetical protein A2W14_04870 [Candidatus Gottesmanbacteria bacterium RBG_16_37_8]|uniref:histidine kinase n=1 Tax=Candidatus Gottesmanbacteria bacterium RBG_16_37_8 TaxID=1798371 RepID=A0A1F5YUQ0_9BACT|nr:MAG: hypothetical protein A2W14_04870 [Candidatus Gottesmanbacteria bacterium RBG_16_37_8]
MNFHSIRFRLTFWYSLTFFLGLLLAFASFYLITNRVLFKQTDSSLIDHGQKVVEVVSRKPDSINEIQSQRSFINEFSEIPGMLVTILDNKSQVVSSSMMCCYDQKIFESLFQQAIAKKEFLITNQAISGENMRFFVSPVYSQNLFLGVVLVSHPIDIIQKSLNSILIILAVISVLLLIPTVIGGYLLSKKALLPISDLSEKLKFITTENLHQKVADPHSSDEIEKLIQSFNLLLDRLSLAFKRERQFIGDIAHELKTPLSIMSGNIELALSKYHPPKEYQKVLKETAIDANNMSRTLNNILDLAWSQADNFKINLKTFNLSKILEDLNEIAASLARPKKITVKSSLVKNLFVSGHPDKLIRSILNIIDNAVKYSPAKTTITISLSKKGQNAHLEIKDQGKGITQKDLPHIFDRFYRADSVKNIEGSGLGLAIAEGIINAHQGHLHVDSTPGKGTRITITLPLTKHNR